MMQIFDAMLLRSGFLSFASPMKKRIWRKANSQSNQGHPSKETVRFLCAKINIIEKKEILRVCIQRESPRSSVFSFGRPRFRLRQSNNIVQNKCPMHSRCSRPIRCPMVFLVERTSGRECTWYAQGEYHIGH